MAPPTKVSAFHGRFGGNLEFEQHRRHDIEERARAKAEHAQAFEKIKQKTKEYREGAKMGDGALGDEIVRELLETRPLYQLPSVVLGKTEQPHMLRFVEDYHDKLVEGLGIEMAQEERKAQKLERQAWDLKIQGWEQKAEVWEVKEARLQARYDRRDKQCSTLKEENTQLDEERAKLIDEHEQVVFEYKMKTMDLNSEKESLERKLESATSELEVTNYVLIQTRVERNDALAQLNTS